MNTSKTLVAAILGSVAMLAAGQACAHSALVKSNPAPNATVAPPKVINLTFNEALTPAFSGFDIAMSDGMKMRVKTTLSKDKKTIMGAPTGKLMAGAYKVNWHATATDDGHRTKGMLAFMVK
ncbi:copper homeostasis periplasmic binding protein CopC [soil metagenome]